MQRRNQNASPGHLEAQPALMIEKKKKSVAPVYGVAVACALYCAFFPLYKTWHFIVFACSAALVYVILSRLFPGKTEYIEIPEHPARTGDDKIDALLKEGETAVAEMRRLCDTILDEAVRHKLDGIISVTDRIFKNLLDDPNDYKQTKRFADFYLPTTIKLLHSYDRFGRSGAQGGNVTGTMERIESALDTILESYKKFFDSLFENQALDIETDIRVLETVLKKEGLLNSEFKE